MIVVAVDVETGGLHHTDGLVSISFTSGGKSVAFAVNHPEQENTEKEALDKIQRIIDKADVLVGHKAHFEIKHLLNAGIKFKHQKWACTKIMYWLYTGHRAKDTSLNTVAMKLLGNSKVEGYDFSKKKAYEYPLKGLLKYNKQDTVLTMQIYDKLIKHMPVGLMEFYSDMSYFLARKEMAGMYVCKDTLRKKREEIEEELNRVEAELKEELEYPINIGSTQQLSCALYGGTFIDKKKRKVFKEYKTVPSKWVMENYEEEVTLKGLGFNTSKLTQTKDGYWPVSKEALLVIKSKYKKSRDWLSKFTKWKDLFNKYSKEIKNTEGKLIEDLLYGNFHAVGTSTGRISSSKENLQNKKIRDIYTSRYDDGRILAVDFSGIQWRIAAMFSKDPKMISDIKDGLDPHKVTYSDVFEVPYEEVTDELKKPAKAVNFGILFGKTSHGYAKDPLLPQIPDLKVADKFVDGVFKSRPKLKQEIDRSVMIADGKGRIDMENGRWYDFTGDYFKKTQIFNYRVQGREVDIVFPCYFEVGRIIEERFKGKALVVNTVHDEIVLDCINEEVAMELYRIIKKVFTNAEKYVNIYYPEIDLSAVPIDCDGEIGKSWGEMENIEEEE